MVTSTTISGDMNEPAFQSEGSHSVEDADLLFCKGLLIEAMNLYQALASDNPTCIRSRAGYAKCLALTGRIDKALRQYEQILADNPHSASALIGIANIYRNKGDHLSAINFYEKAVNNPQGLIQPYLGLAKTYLGLQSYDKALQYAEKGLQFQEHDELKALVAVCHCSNDEYSKAKAIRETITDTNNKQVLLLDYNLAFADGKLDVASAISGHILSQYKNDPLAWASLLVLSAKTRDVENVRKLLALYEHKTDHDLISYHAFAEAYSSLGNTSMCLEYVEKCLRLAPQHVPSIRLKCSLLKQEGHYHEALKILEDLSDRSYSIALVSEIIELKLKTHNDSEALLLLDKAFLEAQTVPDKKSVLNLLLVTGSLDKARDILDYLYEHNPNDTGLWQIIGECRDTAKARYVVDHLCNTSLLDLSRLPFVSQHYALSELYRLCGDYEQSAVQLQIANNRAILARPSTLDAHLDNISRIESGLINCRPKKHPQNSSEKTPIFIIGMPRSGSTLLETILSCNDELLDLGECRILQEALQLMTDQSVRDSITLDSLYHKLIYDQTGSDTKITSNKMLSNYLHIPLILAAFPNAKIIHTTRHPLDNALSIYKANFEDDHIAYSNSLADIGTLIAAVNQFIEKRSNEYPGLIYKLDYDKLVVDPENQIRSLIAWLGWQWDAKYLSPHETRKIALTASKSQIRSKISAKSLHGWKRYAEMLRPAAVSLAKEPSYHWIVADYANLGLDL